MDERENELERQAILRTDERWIVAFNAGDIETLVALYDADAIVMPPGRTELRGRAEIRSWFVGFFAENSARQTLVNDEVVVELEGQL